MIALMLSIAVCAAQPKELTWQQALDKIAPYMSGFKVSKDRNVNSERMSRIIKKAGLPRGEESLGTSRDQPGYYLDYESNVVKVQGMKAYIVRINRIVQAPRQDPRESVLAIFEQNRNQVAARKMLAPPSLPDVDYPIVSCVHACRSSSWLITTGQYYWFGNRPQPSIQLWKRNGSTWSVVDQKTAEFETFEVPLVRPSANKGFVIQPMEGRTYPEYLDACHNSERRTYRQVVAFKNGRLRTTSLHLVDSPYNLLDRLYHAICIGDKKMIARSSLNHLVAKHILGLRPRTKEGTADTDFPGYCDTYSRQIAVWNLKVWFHFTRKNGRWVVAKLSPYTRFE